MTWYKAWREMLQGVRLVMSLVERRGLVDVLVVGISSRSSSGSTMGSELDCCVMRSGILVGFLVGVGRMSWIWL